MSSIAESLNLPSPTALAVSCLVFLLATLFASLNLFSYMSEAWFKIWCSMTDEAEQPACRGRVSAILSAGSSASVVLLLVSYFMRAKTV